MRPPICRAHCAVPRLRAEPGSDPAAKMRRREPLASAYLADWLAGSAATASAMSCRVTCRSSSDIGIVRLASAKLSNPHMPHPAGPTKRRRLAANASDRSPVSHIRSTIPSATLTTANSAISAGRGNNSFGVSETERKILEIVGGRHQDSVRRTVIAEGDRHLFGQGAFSRSAWSHCATLALGRVAPAAARRARASNADILIYPD